MLYSDPWPKSKEIIIRSKQYNFKIVGPGFSTYLHSGMACKILSKARAQDRCQSSTRSKRRKKANSVPTTIARQSATPFEGLGFSYYNLRFWISIPGEISCDNTISDMPVWFWTQKHNYGCIIHQLLYSTVYPSRHTNWPLEPGFAAMCKLGCQCDEGTKNVIRAELKILSCRKYIKECVLRFFMFNFSSMYSIYWYMDPRILKIWSMNYAYKNKNNPINYLPKNCNKMHESSKPNVESGCKRLVGVSRR